MRAGNWRSIGLQIGQVTRGWKPRKNQFAILLVLTQCGLAPAQTYTISTFAGGGLPTNIAGVSASLQQPRSLALDRDGNVFFVDSSTNAAMGLDAKSGIVTVIAGNGTGGFSGDNGAAIDAQLLGPSGIAVDSAGDVYIADLYNNRVRKVSKGVITTFAGDGSSGFGGDDGPATSAWLNRPFAVAVDSTGNVYIADSQNNRIRKVSNGTITTLAGNSTPGYGGDDGPVTGAQLNTPLGVAVDATGSVYIADTNNNRIRRISQGIITTIAGTGTAGLGTNQLNRPSGITIASNGDLYIADTYNNSIRRFSAGEITTMAGGGSTTNDSVPATSAFLTTPISVAVTPAGDVIFPDPSSARIRKVSGGIITSIAGNRSKNYAGDNGPATSAQLDNPEFIALDPAGNLYISDTLNGVVRKVSNGIITTVAGSTMPLYSTDNRPALSSLLNNPQGLAADAAGNLYIAETLRNRIRKVSLGVITTIAGTGSAGYAGDNGPAISAWLDQPAALALNSGGDLYIDDGRSRVRKVSGGSISTVAGDGTCVSSSDEGPATTTALSCFIWGITVDSAGTLFLADASGGTVLEVSEGTIRNIAWAAEPAGVAVDSAGNLIFTDRVNGLVLKFYNGVVTTIAGGGSSLGDGGPATRGQLFAPYSVVVDSQDRIYVADSYNNRVRLLTPNKSPSIAQGGIVPIDGSGSVIQPGSWASIYGVNLAETTTLWNNDFPTSLAGSSVTIDNKPAYLWFVSPTQINFQAPDDTTGTVNVVVTTPAGTATGTVLLAAQAPAFSLLADGLHVAGEIITPDGTGAYGGGGYDLVGPSGSFSFSTRPVRTGETIALFGVGFGPTSPTVPAGNQFSGAAPTVMPVTVTIGGVNASVAFAGITAAGLYQINVIVPKAPAGDQPIVATINDAQTPQGALITIQ